jgi:hypothetical protein
MLLFGQWIKSINPPSHKVIRTVTAINMLCFRRRSMGSGWEKCVRWQRSVTALRSNGRLQRNSIAQKKKKKKNRWGERESRNSDRTEWKQKQNDENTLHALMNGMTSGKVSFSQRKLIKLFNRILKEMQFLVHWIFWFQKISNLHYVFSAVPNFL